MTWGPANKGMLPREPDGRDPPIAERVLDGGVSTAQSPIPYGRLSHQGLC